MKKALALLLTLSMIFALAALGGGQAFASDAAAGEEVGSEMWMLKLLAATALGDSDAMATLGQAYYKGEGVEKDYAAALDWLRKAADAGSTDALVTLGTMYLNGEGVEKDAAKAQEYFTRATTGNGAAPKPAAETKAAAGKPQADGDKACLEGKWGELEWLRNGPNNFFYLDETVTNAEWVEFTMVTPKAPRGYPYGDWYLYVKDTDGNWSHVAKFALEKNMTNGKPVTMRLKLDKPSTFTAITITSVEGGMDFTLWRFIDFYVDPSCVPEGSRDFTPDSFEDQIAAYAGREYPLTAQYFQYQAYSSDGGSSSGGRQSGNGYYDPPNGTNNNQTSATTR